MKRTGSLVLAFGLAVASPWLASCGDSATSGCTAVILPGPTAAMDAAHAFVAARSGDEICFQPGTYMLADELDLNVPNVTVRGILMGTDRPILDFTGATAAPQAMDIQTMSSNFTMKDLVVRNSHGDGVRVDMVTGVTFQNVKVTWTDASGADTSSNANGAYALYPVGCTNVLIEQCEIFGARDAGLYVGQSSHIVLRHNFVHGNVAGLEIENCDDAEVFGTDATDNTAGILVFDLPGMMKENGMTTRVHDNHTHGNNRQNFAVMGSTVSNVPDGLGIMVMASNFTEVDANLIEQNDTTAILVVSYKTLSDISMTALTDHVYDPWLDGAYIHDNTYVMNGTMPSMTSLAVVAVMGYVSPEQSFFEDILYDGNTNPASPPTMDTKLCIHEDASVTFRDFDENAVAMHINGVMGALPVMMSTDRSPYDCTHAAQAPVTWPGLPPDTAATMM